MKILFKNAMVLTMENDEILKNALVAVEDDKIAYVGEACEDWLNRAYDRVVDASGHMIMPGFINTPAHLAMTLLRGYGSGLPLQSWLEDKIWPVEELYEDEDYYVGSQMAVAEMLRSGTTCLSDMYMGMDLTAKVLCETGMRGVLSRGMVAFSKEMLEPKLAENVKLYEDWHGKENGRIQVFLGPHAEYTNTAETMPIYAATAKELGCGIHIHVSETASEVAGCVERHGMSPVRFLKKMDIFDGRALAAHCVHVSEEDMCILAEHGVGVAHNPSSNIKLASGFAPVAKMLDKGVHVGIGTDGVASNDRMDMLREANLASLIAKGFSGDPTQLDAFTTLRMATLGGAQALGMADRLGTVTVGKQADLIMLDLTGPAYQPENEMMNHLVYSANSTDVVMTMVDGRILMENGVLTTMDLDQITKNFTCRAKRLFAGA